MSMVFFALWIARTTGVDAVVGLDDQLHFVLLGLFLLVPLDRGMPVGIELAAWRS